MQVVEIAIEAIVPASWNANVMDGPMLSRLGRSVEGFGLVVPLVVRSIGDSHYETVGGAQRLTIWREIGYSHVPCVVLDADDSEARLLSQCLNRIAGEDDLGLRAELLREVLGTVSQETVLALLPETVQSLQDLASMGQQGMANYLQVWQQAQGARLKHLQFQLTSDQLAVVEQVLNRLLPLAKESWSSSPNARGTCLYLLCLGYLEREWKPA